LRSAYGLKSLIGSTSKVSEPRGAGGLYSAFATAASTGGPAMVAATWEKGGKEEKEKRGSFSLLLPCLLARCLFFKKLPGTVGGGRGEKKREGRRHAFVYLSCLLRLSLQCSLFPTKSHEHDLAQSRKFLVGERKGRRKKKGRRGEASVTVLFAPVVLSRLIGKSRS